MSRWEPADVDRLLFDGEVCPAAGAQVSALDRTLLYGLGAFETFRLFGGVPFRLDRHLARLRRSLEALDLESPPGVEALPAGVAALSRACAAPAAICRVTVTAGSAPDSGTRSPMHVLATLRAPPAPWAGRRVVVGVAECAHDARSPVAGVKSTSYLTHYLLREQAEREGRIDDLLVSSDGQVGEASVSSVFVVRAGRLLTPPLSAGVLEGVTRGEVLRLARALGVPVAEQGLDLDQLRTADECFLTSAGKGLVTVDEVAGRELPEQRPLARRLAAALADAIGACCGVDPASIVF